MKVLFYNEPKSIERGPNAVAWHLSKELSNKIDITYFPQITSKKTLNLFSVYRKYFSNEFDIVHYSLAPSWFNGSSFFLDLANHRKTPTVLNIHGLIEVENTYEPARFSNLSRINCFNSCKLVSKVVANSDYMKSKISLLYNIQPEKIVVIPNGIDFAKFALCNARISLAGDPAILNVSRVCMLKGFGTLIEAVSQLKNDLPKMKVHLVGYASKEYMDLAKRKEVENFFIFHGIIPHPFIPKYLKSADFGIYGSIVYEGFGISLVEAMASGLPVIASDIDTYRQIVSDGQDGLLFRRSNADELSKAILNMSKDSTLRRKLSQNAQITTARYDWGKIAEEYLSLYKEMSDCNS